MKRLAAIVLLCVAAAACVREVNLTPSDAPLFPDAALGSPPDAPPADANDFPDAGADASTDAAPDAF